MDRRNCIAWLAPTAICLAIGAVARGEPIEVLTHLIEVVETPALSAGPLASISATIDAQVEAGEELARIDDGQAQLLIEKAQAELDVANAKANNALPVESARKAWEVARNDYDRVLQQERDFAGSVTRSELEKKKLAAEQALLQIKEAQHEQAVAKAEVLVQENILAQARRELALKIVKAPFPGRVVEIDRHAGEWVEPGDRLLRLVRLDELYAKGFLSRDMATDGLKGNPVQLTVRLPGGKVAAYNGTIEFVSPEINPGNGKTPIWARIQNTDGRLRPGLQGAMSFVDRGE